jgi:hypothetical protein
VRAPTPTNISTNSEPLVEERHLRFAGRRLRDQRLSCTWRSDDQHTLRDFAAQPRKPLRSLQELDDFLQLGNGLVSAADVLVSDANLASFDLSGLALPDAKHPTAHRTRAPVCREPERTEQEQWEEPEQDEFPDRTGRRPDAILHAGGVELVEQLRIAVRRRDRVKGNRCLARTSPLDSSSRP